jgi:metal-responsive CopG/Arc/MetJ family transcriptional regulator
MSKKVISFRFSDAELADLDEACQRFHMNRSELLATAIQTLLRDYTHEKGTLLRRADWFMTALPGDDGEKTRS